VDVKDINRKGKFGVSGSTKDVSQIKKKKATKVIKECFAGLNNTYIPTKFMPSKDGLEYVIGGGLFHKKREGGEPEIMDFSPDKVKVKVKTGSDSGSEVDLGPVEAEVGSIDDFVADNDGENNDYDMGDDMGDD